MDLKEVERVVTKIQGALFKNSNSYSIGLLKSHFRGSGLQFKEHQVYCHGDDVRFIDWKLYARSNTPYIKTFEEERNVEIIIFIDISLGMFMGYKGISKLQAAINIACLISLLAKETNDCVQFVLSGDDEKILPKSSGKKAIIHLVKELRKLNIMKEDGKINLAYRPQKEVIKKNKLKAINRFIKQKKEVVILSDFNDVLEEDDLGQISKNKRTHCFRIVSPIDKGMGANLNIFSFNASKVFSAEKCSISLKVAKKEKEWEGGGDSHVKIIDIEKRYLEDFVKELI